MSTKLFTKANEAVLRTMGPTESILGVQTEMPTAILPNLPLLDILMLRQYEDNHIVMGCSARDA